MCERKRELLEAVGTCLYDGICVCDVWTWVMSVCIT